ncbi:MAG: hypothetical protein JWL88_135 [Parcubacteria group bacterium]|nr:hypothetical protein [Parcubacteria group bacterium]
MKQVVVVHGGETFASYEAYLAWLRMAQIDIGYQPERYWKSSLQQDLGEEYQIILPRMPNSLNARYSEWKTWFDKYIHQVEDGVVLVGHSLGGIFLAKYLSTENPEKRIAAVLLVAAPFDEEYEDGNSSSLNDFALPESLEKMQSQTGVIHLFQSTDDPVVAYSSVQKYKVALPEAILHMFSDRRHFDQESFPELVEVIRSL